MGRKQDFVVRGGNEYIGLVGFDTDIIGVTFTLDTSAYASGDLLANPAIISNCARQLGGRCRLDSVVLLDADDQGVALSVVFTQVSTSFGTLNSAPDISDANLATVQGHVAFATTDYVDAGGAKIGTRNNLGLMMETGSNSQSLYAALINGSGTPTFTAAGVTAKFGFTRF